MDIITCPNCGKLLEYQSVQQDAKVINCPKCGIVPLMEDSQVITISGGEVGGPGLANLNDQGEEFVIREGMAIAKEAHQDIKIEESVIEGVQDAGQMIVCQNERNYKMPEATVEERLDFEWQGESKEVGHPLIPNSKDAPPKQRYTQKARSPEKRYTQRSRDRVRPREKMRGTQRTRRKKNPWYYYAIFYGIPTILLLALISFTLWKFLNSTRKPQEVIVGVGPQEIWMKADNACREAEINYQEALIYKDKHNSKKYLQKLVKSDSLYKKALDLGRKSWQGQIELLMEQKNIPQQKAENFAMLNYGGYQQKMQLWQQKHRRVKELLAIVHKPK